MEQSSKQTSESKDLKKTDVTDHFTQMPDGVDTATANSNTSKLMDHLGAFPAGVLPSVAIDKFRMVLQAAESKSTPGLLLGRSELCKLLIELLR